MSSIRPMSIPIIAIVGRPNVGKSRLFNRMVGKSQALVDDRSGVTRDRQYGLGDWRDSRFMVVDTGGLIPGAEDPLNQKIWSQAFEAIREADILIPLFDGQEGITPVDRALVQELRKIKKPKFFTVNKIDLGGHEHLTSEFVSLGIDVIAVSAEHGRGVSDLMERLYDQIGPSEPAVAISETMTISIIGRPNVGKSTLTNTLLGQERQVVDAKAGTTTDAIDVAVAHNGKNYTFIDTAGFKRKRQTITRLEKFSVVKALRTIDRSQIVLYMIDALEGITHHDLYLMYMIWEDAKGLVLLVNKWDQMKMTPLQYMNDLRPQLKQLQGIPILCISAKTGGAVSQIWTELRFVEEGLGKRLTTAALNNWLEKAKLQHPLPTYRGRAVQILYATQVGTRPPHVVLFTNEPQGIPDSYRRFLLKNLTTAMEIEGLPIRLSFRKRK